MPSLTTGTVHRLGNMFRPCLPGAYYVNTWQCITSTGPIHTHYLWRCQLTHKRSPCVHENNHLLPDELNVNPLCCFQTMYTIQRARLNISSHRRSNSEAHHCSTSYHYFLPASYPTSRSQSSSSEANHRISALVVYCWASTSLGSPRVAWLLLLHVYV